MSMENLINYIIQNDPSYVNFSFEGYSEAQLVKIKLKVELEKARKIRRQNHI